MRRILRKVAAGEEDSIGDISTLADPSVSVVYECWTQYYILYIVLVVELIAY